MGGDNGFDLTIKDGKVFHELEEITDYVKNMRHWWTNRPICFVSNNGDRSVVFKDIIFSNTGCERVETSIHEWLELANKAGL